MNAPPPVAQTVDTLAAIPFFLDSSKKLFISLVGNLMKCNVPILLQIFTLSICEQTPIVKPRTVDI